MIYLFVLIWLDKPCIRSLPTCSIISASAVQLFSHHFCTFTRAFRQKTRLQVYLRPPDLWREQVTITKANTSVIQKANNNKIKKTIKHISGIIVNKYLKITALRHHYTHNILHQNYFYHVWMLSLNLGIDKSRFTKITPDTNVVHDTNEHPTNPPPSGVEESVHHSTLNETVLLNCKSFISDNYSIFYFFLSLTFMSSIVAYHHADIKTMPQWLQAVKDVLSFKTQGDADEFNRAENVLLRCSKQKMPY